MCRFQDSRSCLWGILLKWSVLGTGIKLMRELFQMKWSNAELNLTITDEGKKGIGSPVMYFGDDETIFRAGMAFNHKEWYHVELCRSVWARILWLSQLLAQRLKLTTGSLSRVLFQCGRSGLGCSLFRTLYRSAWRIVAACLQSKACVKHSSYVVLCLCRVLSWLSSAGKEAAWPPILSEVCCFLPLLL